MKIPLSRSLRRIVRMRIMSLLRDNLKNLKSLRLENNKQLNIVEIPMPQGVEFEGMRLPASYANFYISNKYVIVPTFRDKNDDKALRILQGCFPDRKVVGLDSVDIIWGLGSFPLPESAGTCSLEGIRSAWCNTLIQGFIKFHDVINLVHRIKEAYSNSFTVGLVVARNLS